MEEFGLVPNERVYFKHSQFIYALIEELEYTVIQSSSLLEMKKVSIKPVYFNEDANEKYLTINTSNNGYPCHYIRCDSHKPNIK